MREIENLILRIESYWHPPWWIDKKLDIKYHMQTSRWNPSLQVYHRVPFPNLLKPKLKLSLITTWGKLLRNADRLLQAFQISLPLLNSRNNLYRFCRIPRLVEEIVAGGPIPTPAVSRWPLCFGHGGDFAVLVNNASVCLMVVLFFDI